jgi:hypothetical protein
MNRQEAGAFIRFLQSEIYRHKRDIDEAQALIKRVEIMLKSKSFKDVEG